jgi:hypothetical protein
MEVYVSAAGFSEEQALDWLARHGLEGHTQGTTSVRADGSREPGAVVRIHKYMSPRELEPLWLDLRDKAGLECAHLVVPGAYRGCVYGYLHSPCPRLAPYTGP